jgi:pimeloyl-ACP methyl ester carboxylesterase
MNGYADDLAALIEALDLNDVTLVGHSTGGGEVTRYIGRHGTKRVAAAVLIAAVPPIMVKTAANPEGLPIEVFDGLRSSLAKDRARPRTWEYRNRLNVTIWFIFQGLVGGMCIGMLFRAATQN